MKILFLNPPFLPKFSREQRSPAVTKSGTLYYPMWLCYAAGVAEKSGFEVKVIDAPAQRMNHVETLSLVEEFSPALTVVDTSTPSIFNDIDFATKIQTVTGSYIVVVGTHPSALPEEILMINESIHLVARREYELTILEIASLLRSGEITPETLKAVDGISFRKDSNIYHTKDRDFVEDLDSLPFVSEVYGKHIDYKKYFYAHSKYPIITLITGRGCPYHCFYCLYPQTFNGHKIRYRSIKNVVDEIEYCLRRFDDVQEIMFEDDTFTLSKSRLVEFADEILKRGLKFKWSCNSRADVDLETMKLLKRAGARLFCVGIESGDQKILDSMKKNLKIEKIKEFFTNAKQAGILIHGCFLVGSIGETIESLHATLDFAIELNPDTVQFFPIMIYPGTEAYTWAKESGFLTTNKFNEWLTPEGLHNCVISRPGLSNYDLVQFCDAARKRFYTRPSYIKKKLIQGLYDFQEMKRFVKGALSLSNHMMTGTYRKKERHR